MIIPISIHGTDSSGQLFKENTWTIGVNKQGAKIATFRPLLLGAQISVINPVLGRTAKARVIWVGEKRFPEDPYEVGVELTEAQNVWGIKFPPEDWQRPVGAGSRAAEATTEAVVRLPATKSAAPAPLEAPKPPEGQSGEESVEAGKDSEKFNQFNLVVGALSHFAQQTEPAARGRVEAFPEAASKSIAAAALQTHATLQQAAAILEALQEKERSLRALEEQLKTQAQSVQSARDQLDAALARVQEVERGGKAEVEKTQENIRQASANALEAALEKLAPQLVEGLTRSFDQEAQTASQRAERAFQEKLEILRKQIEEETSNTGRKFRETREHEVELVKKIIADRVDWAVNSLNLATGSAAETLSAAYRKAEGDLRALSVEYPGKLEALENADLERFRSRAQALLADLQTSLQKTWSQFQEKGARELGEQLQKKSEEFEELWAKALQRQAEDVSEMLTEQIKGAGAQLVEETRKQLGVTGQSTREAIAREAETTLETVKSLGEKLGASGKALVDETAQQLSGMSRAMLDSLAKQAQGISEEGSAQARKTFQELQERGSEELKAQLRTAFERNRESMLKQLQQEAHASSERAVAQLKSQIEGMVQETSDAVYKQVGMGAVILKDWTEQARSQLDGFLQKSTEAFEKQTTDISRATLEHYRSGSETLVEDLRARLQQASRIFQAQATERSVTKGPEANDNPAERAAPRPAVTKGQDFDPTLEQLKKKQEQALSEAAEAFRKKLAEMLEGFELRREPRK